MSIRWVIGLGALGLGGYLFVKKGGLILAKLAYEEAKLRWSKR